LRKAEDLVGHLVKEKERLSKCAQEGRLAEALSGFIVYSHSLKTIDGLIEDISKMRAEQKKLERNSSSAMPGHQTDPQGPKPD
jgi:hypothetical protein